VFAGSSYYQKISGLDAERRSICCAVREKENGRYGEEEKIS
jgi:hypothetical protein